MFMLAAFNRYRVTGNAMRGDVRAVRALATSVKAEWVLVAIVVVLVASFRLTTPPRSLFAQAPRAAPLFAMLATGDASNMANVDLLPGRVGQNEILIQITDRRMTPIAVEGVTVSLTDAAAGVEPIVRTATKASGTIWRVDGLTIPLGGEWTIKVQALLSEFQEADLTAAVVVGP
jgi:copper transport protein